VVIAWRNGWAFTAGFAAGILFFKPQLAAVVLAAMGVTLGWRTFAGASVSLGMILLANLVMLPGTLGEYLHRLSPNVQVMLSTHSYLWARHTTINGFWHVLLNPENAPTASILAMVCSVPLAAGLLLCVWRQRQAISRDRTIAAVIMTAPLIMPYYLDYDLLLLAIPAVLLAKEMIQREPGEILNRRDRWLIRLWIVYFAELLINPGLTNAIGINIGVLLLTSISVLHIARAVSASPAAVVHDESEFESLRNPIHWPAAAA